MRTYHLSNRGNVDDIRCSLKHGSYSIEELLNEIDYEKSNKNRSSVIALYEAAIRKLKRVKK